MCDCVMPAAFSENWRVARVKHMCCECHRDILPGERYQYVSGIWDGSPSDYKSCLMCAKTRDLIIRMNEGDCVSYTSLIEEIREAARLFNGTTRLSFRSWDDDPATVGWAAGLVYREELVD